MNEVDLRFATDNISETIYNKATHQLVDQLRLLMLEEQKTTTELSNFESRLDKGLQLLQNLSLTWSRSSLEGRRKLQKALFPYGLMLGRSKAQQVELYKWTESDRTLSFPNQL